MAKVSLTNQTVANYKLLANLAALQKPPKEISDLMVEEIVDFMWI